MNVFRLRALGALVLAGGVSTTMGCRQVSLSSRPEIFSSSPSPDVPHGLFDVEWQVRLVPPRTWEYEPREYASPALDPDTGHIVAATRDGIVRAVDSQGKVQWSYRTPNAFSAGPEVQQGVVYAPGGDGVLYALDSRTGALKWKAELGEELATKPVVTGGRVLVASHGGTVFSLDVNDGQKVWQYRRDLPPGFNIRGVSRPVIEGSTAYLGFADGFVAALNLSDGTANWERNVSGDANEFLDVDTSPVLDEAGRLLVASYRSGIFALDRETGSELWRQSERGVTGLAGRGAVLFSSGDSSVGAWHSETGRPIWKLPLKGRAGTTPVLADGHLVVPVSSSLLFVDPATGKARLAWDPGRGVDATPLHARSRLYVLSNNGFLYSLLLERGS